MTAVTHEQSPRSEHRNYPDAIERYRLWLFNNTHGLKQTLRQIGINIKGNSKELAKRLEGVTAGVIGLKNVVDGKFKVNYPKAEPILLLDILNNTDSILLLSKFGRDFDRHEGKISTYVGINPSNPSAKILVLYQKTSAVTEKVCFVEFFAQNQTGKKQIENTHLLLPSNKAEDEIEFNQLTLPPFLQIATDEELITATIRTREIFRNGSIPDIKRNRCEKGLHGQVPVVVAINPYSQSTTVNQVTAESYYEKLSTV